MVDGDTPKSLLFLTSNVIRVFVLWMQRVVIPTLRCNILRLFDFTGLCVDVYALDISCFNYPKFCDPG